MTIDEAKIYLPIDQDEELVDCYELKLFELKQFLSSNFPVTKVVNSKLKRLEKLDEAFITLGGVFKDSVATNVEGKIKGESLDQIHASYTYERNRLRMLIMNSRNGSELRLILMVYLDLIRQYAVHWKGEYQGQDKVVVSKEPDVMELQKAIAEFKAEGKASFEEMKNSDESKNILVGESKRLSLWLKLDANV